MSDSAVAVREHEGITVRDHTQAERLLDRLEDPRTAAALNTLLDNVELIAALVAGLDGLARKGDLIADTLTEVMGQVKAAGRATGLDAGKTTEQLATLIPALAEAAPAINRVARSSIVEPEPIEVLSEAAVALVKGLQSAQQKDARLGLTGLLKATRHEDVQRGIGFLVEVAREFGSDMRKAAVRRTGTTQAAARPTSA
jgi:hypothetical protein